MIAVLLLLPSIVFALGDLWCQSGGNKDFAPAQCEPQTLECWKYVCKESRYDESDFIARGCGVSLATTATGLPNESCHQAIAVCEQLGGKGECHVCDNKHLCNSSSRPPLLLLVSTMLVIILL